MKNSTFPLIYCMALVAIAGCCETKERTFTKEAKSSLITIRDSSEGKQLFAESFTTKEKDKDVDYLIDAGLTQEEAFTLLMEGGSITKSEFYKLTSFTQGMMVIVSLIGTVLLLIWMKAIKLPIIPVPTDSLEYIH